MTEQLVARVNDAQARWRQLESQSTVARLTYFRTLESCYETLKEAHQRQNELLIALLNQNEPLTGTPATTVQATDAPVPAATQRTPLPTVEETDESVEKPAPALAPKLKRKDNTAQED